MTDDRPREDGPTELVETETGDMVERLSGGTATLLLVWLIGVGALSTLLAAWLYVWLVFGARLGVGHLLSGFGLYTAIAGASGPCVLWLTGRAQGHTLAWFMLTGAKVALVMVATVLAIILLATLVLGGAIPGLDDALLAGALVVVAAVGLAQVWAVATWAADRWIARARTEP